MIDPTTIPARTMRENGAADDEALNPVRRWSPLGRLAAIFLSGFGYWVALSVAVKAVL